MFSLVYLIFVDVESKVVLIIVLSIFRRFSGISAILQLGSRRKAISEIVAARPGI